MIPISVLFILHENHLKVTQICENFVFSVIMKCNQLKTIVKEGNMNQSFSDFGLSQEILKSLEELGYSSPTEVQGKVIPKVLLQEDLIVISKTGSGKTGAFGIPMLHALEKTDDGPKALILTPTRELAVQVDQDLKQMSKYKPVRTTVLYGGHSMQQEIEKLSKGAEIVTGTPGRVFDHMNQGNLKTNKIEYLVLDEADRMLDMGFFDQVQRIIKRIPGNRVTMLFSATMPPEIQKLCKTYMKTPETIEIESETKTVDSISQFYYKVESNEKRKQLHRILTVEQPDSCMVFCNTRIAVDRVNEFLEGKGYTCKALHGANSQSNRMRSIQQFKKGDFEVLVATDVAARGIHVDDLSLVINYDVPLEKDSYVHRIGRTGRAGNGGRAITLVTKDDLFSLYEIEEHVGVLIQEEPLPTDAEVASKPQKTPKPRPRVDHALASEHKSSRPHSHSKAHGQDRKGKVYEGTKPAHDGVTTHARPVHGASGHKPSQAVKSPNHNKSTYQGKATNHGNKPYESIPASNIAKPTARPVTPVTKPADAIIKPTMKSNVQPNLQPNENLPQKRESILTKLTKLFKK